MTMQQVFALQFAGALVAWGLIAVVWVRPAIADWERVKRVALWTTPLLFRFLGLGLLSPNLSPGIDEDFARNTAIGDGVTALLAVIALVALSRRWRVGILLAWLAHAVGLGDLAIALPHAARVQASTNLTAQWYVAAVAVPMMLVAHVMAVWTLSRRGEP